jgi:hypothetical protein
VIELTTELKNLGDPRNKTATITPRATDLPGEASGVEMAYGKS